MNNRRSRRQFLGSIATTATGVSVASGEAAACSTGPVYATVDINVRTGPGTGYEVIAVVDEGTGGRVVDGPVSADGYTWWKVRWNGDTDDGCVTGWSAGGDCAWIASADFANPAPGLITADWYTSGSGGYHQALDIANDKYTNVYAGRSGYHTQHWASGCGNYSVIDHGGGYETRYCHLDSFVAGDGTDVGNPHHIGEMGATGDATGPHVHFEVNRYGDAVFVPGEVGEEICAMTGVPRNYSNLSSF